jgi:hypothetical protein
MERGVPTKSRHSAKKATRKKPNKVNKRSLKTIPTKLVWHKKVPEQYRKVLFLFLLWTITVLWWSKFKDYKFVQDDLLLFPYFQDEKLSALYQVFGGAEIANRWRPVTNFFTWLIVESIGTNHFMWFLLNVTLITLTGFVLGILILRKTNNFSITVFVAFVFASSRFQTGLVTQATFIVENISNLLFVILFSILVSKVAFSSADVLKITGLFAAIILTHERYVTLGLPIVIAIFLKANNRRQKSYGIFLNTILVLAFFSVKKFFLQIPLFVGTGSAWDVGFSFESFFRHIAELVIGLFGINIGSATLNGYVIQNQGPVSVFLSISIFILCVAQFWNHVFDNLVKKPTKDRLSGPLLPFSLFFALVIPVASTIRIEQRWFLATYIVFLYYLIPELLVKRKKKVFRPIFIILILSILMNFSYMKNTDDIYFNRDALGASKNAKVYFEALANTNDIATKVAIVSTEDFKAFDLWYKNFFEINYPGTSFDPDYYSSVSEATSHDEIASVLTLESGILTELQSSFGSKGYVLMGDYWSDGWVGKNLSLSTSNQTCRVIRVDFLGSIFSNSVQIYNGDRMLTLEKSLKEAKSIDLEINRVFDTFKFDFKDTYIPNKLGLNPDVRSLATRMEFSCIK